MIDLILASGSPRRRELLQSLALSFRVVPSNVEEVLQSGESPEGYVRRLAGDKSDLVARLHPESWVIAADTIVELNGEILEKPIDESDAADMISKIAGRTHTVFTGVSLQCLSAGHRETAVAETRVTMSPMSDAAIEWYVATGEPLDKAGGYAAQAIGAVFIERIEGSHTNVVGLPLALLFQMLSRAGVHLSEITQHRSGPAGFRIGT